MSGNQTFSLAPDDRPLTTPGGRTCPKCSYARKPTDSAPPWQCPRCEVIYDKVATSASVAQRAAQRDEAARKSQPKPAGPWRWILLALLLVAGAWWAAAAWRAKHPSAAELAARAQAEARRGEVAAAVQEQQVQAQLQLADEHLRMARTEEALAILNRYAAEGNSRAMVSLAVVYRDGYRVPADMPRAMEWLNKAAAEGYAPAFVHLGYASEIGSGLAQDYDQAVNQYGKAARQGHMTGLYCLGVIHARGVRGFPPNPLLAHFLLDLAHRAFEANPAGDAQAPDRKSASWASGELRELAQKMSPVDIVKARELADAWRPGQPFPG